MNLDASYFLITIIFFIIGFFISYLLKSHYKIQKPVPSSPNNDYSDIIDVIENSKQLQIDTIMNKINDIQIRLDLVESSLSQLKMSYADTNMTFDNQNITEKSQGISQNTLQSDIAHVTNSETSQPSIINSKPIVLFDKQNSTNYYILKILLKESLTSNEIKNAIGRTREHTARLMKKLYELKFVDRDINIKPFKYRLTEQGKKYIEEHLEKNDFNLSSHTTVFDLTR